MRQKSIKRLMIRIGADSKTVKYMKKEQTKMTKRGREKHQNINMMGGEKIAKVQGDIWFLDQYCIGSVYFWKERHSRYR
jgi:hypothetical protein